MLLSQTFSTYFKSAVLIPSSNKLSLKADVSQHWPLCLVSTLWYGLLRRPALFLSRLTTNPPSSWFTRIPRPYDGMPKSTPISSNWSKTGSDHPLNRLEEFRLTNKPPWSPETLPCCSSYKHFLNAEQYSGSMSEQFR